jgi:ABC-2 type transport system permease protein
VSAVTVTRSGVAARPARVARGYRFELVKLLAQWRVRLLFALCWLGPAVLVAVVGQQDSLPADTVFGRWMGQTGWAGSLVGLAASGTFVLPLVTALVAGDVFAAEDRLTVLLLLLAGLPVSSIAGGLATVGDHPLVGLDGHLLGSGDAAVAVLLAWAVALAPTVAFAAVGWLGSVAFGRSPLGLVLPALLALLLQVAQILPLPVVVRAALPTYAFVAWHGLFTDPVQAGPIVVGVVVALAWAAAAAALAYRLFMRRDFTDVAFDGAGRGIVLGAVAPLAALLAVTVGVLAAATSATGSGVDKAKLDASLATAFAHLYRLQTAELHRPEVTEAQLATSASCDKGGSLVDDVGPGNDWRCVVTWHLPGARATGSAIYQLDVTPDGRYAADGDGPQAVNGFFQVRTPTGDAANPLWQFDGSVDLLTSTSKG